MYEIPDGAGSGSASEGNRGGIPRARLRKVGCGARTLATWRRTHVEFVRAAEPHRRPDRLGGRLASRYEREKEEILENHGLWQEAYWLMLVFSWRCLAAATPTINGRSNRRLRIRRLGIPARRCCLKPTICLANGARLH